jgi:hypothetical protein
MNWAMWSSAAYDFPADLPGYTRGAVVELNRKDWALRAGLFEVPSALNSDVLTLNTGGAVVEFEGRYAIFDQSGKLRLGVFANRGNTGNYRQALATTNADPTLDINDVMVGIRRDNLKYGFYANAEQQSPRTSASSLARAGTTARMKSCRSQISTAACRAAYPSRAVIGAARAIRSASAEPSMACPPHTATSSRPAAMAS